MTSMMQRFVGCLALEPAFLTLLFRYTVDLKKRGISLTFFSMATQFILKLNIKIQYKHGNIKQPSH
jgi:hypothetical protein